MGFAVTLDKIGDLKGGEMKEVVIRISLPSLSVGVGIGVVLGGALFLVGTSDTLGTLIGVVFTIAGVFAVVAGIAGLRSKDC